MWIVYILLCDHRTYYVGYTSNIERRLESHRRKENIATKEYSTIELVIKETYPTRIEAEKREHQLKGWGVAKKKALINGDMILLKKLCKP